MCPHLRVLRKKDVTVAVNSLSRSVRTHGGEDGKTNVLGQLVSSALLVSLFKTFTAEYDVLALFEVFSLSL